MKKKSKMTVGAQLIMTLGLMIPSSFKNSNEGLIKLLNTVRLNLSHKNTIHLKKSISSKNQHMLVLSTCGSNDRSRFFIIALKQNEWRIKF